MTTTMLLALTLYLESASEGLTGMQMVASVIVNRAAGRSDDIPVVILRRKQFSCWNDRKPESVPVPDNDAWDTAMDIAEMVVDGSFQPLTDATHYYNPKLCSPKWAEDLVVVARLGNHVFLRDK